MTISSLEAIPRFNLLAERLATAGQPSEEQLAAVAAAGFRLVINLGPHDDPSYALADEAASVRTLGLDYVHIPVQFSSPNLGQLAQFSVAMAAAEGEKVFVHCRHNKRVPVFIALDRILRCGWNREAALGEMHKAWSPDANWKAFIDQALARHAG